MFWVLFVLLAGPLIPSIFEATVGGPVDTPAGAWWFSILAMSVCSFLLWMMCLVNTDAKDILKNRERGGAFLLKVLILSFTLIGLPILPIGLAFNTAALEDLSASEIGATGLGRFIETVHNSFELAYSYVAPHIVPFSIAAVVLFLIACVMWGKMRGCVSLIKIIRTMGPAALFVWLKS